MTSDAEKELSRIERELEAKQKPPGKPPVKQGGWVGSNDEKPVGNGNNVHNSHRGNAVIRHEDQPDAPRP